MSALELVAGDGVYVGGLVEESDECVSVPAQGASAVELCGEFWLGKPGE